MDSEFHNSENEQAASPQLVIRRPDGDELIQDIPTGSGAIAGSDRTCSLHLDGEGVAALHCMIRYENGQTFVKDWYSETGTFVNDQKIDTETVLPDGGVVRIGGFTISVQQRTTTSQATPPDDDTSNSLPGSPGDDQPAGISADLRPTDFSADTTASEPEEPASTVADPCGWLDQPDSVDEQSDLFESAFAIHDDTADAGCDPETFALLQSEVEHLQNELAQRDARIEEMEAVVQAEDHSNSAAPITDASETAALVDRLEQLLEELNQSDERMRTMNELLQLAEEANVAEREERRQIDWWVSDIECRIGEREAEWNAEVEVLRERIVEITSERDDAERRIGKTGATKEQQAEYQRVLEQVRGQADTLRAKLEQIQAEKADLESRLEELNGDGAEEMMQQRVDDALREERLAHAQEQANMARERAELSRVKMELERVREEKSESQSDVDGKFRAFRDHLKDLHKQETREKQDRSLSSRLSNLWKRLEGRSS